MVPCASTACWTSRVAATRPPSTELTMSEPRPGSRRLGRTTVRVLANAASSSSASAATTPTPRASSASPSPATRRCSEDHVQLVARSVPGRAIRLRLRRQSGGARYDGLINPGGRDRQRRLGRHLGGGDAPRRAAGGASRSGFRSRRSASSRSPRVALQRAAADPAPAQEGSLVGPGRDYKVTQTSRAGLLTDLPEFDLGLGLSVRPAVAAGGGIPAPIAGRRRDVRSPAST